VIEWDKVSDRFGIYRNTQSGWIAGVCAGIADRLGVEAIWVRGGFVLVCLLTRSVVGILLYFALAFLLKPRAGMAATSSDAGVQRAYRDFADSVGPPFGSSPERHAADLKSRFAALDGRLNNLEAAVMSDEISLRRKFRDIGA